jgi:hypothetical protein
MKAKEFSEFLDKYIAFLQRVEAAPQADCMSKVSAFFQARSATATVAAALKLFTGISTEMLKLGNSTREFLTIVQSANSLLKEYGKPAVSNDIEITRAALEKFGDFDIASVLEAAEEPKARKVRASTKVKNIRQELVRSYCEKLEAAIGDESRFPAIYTELSEQKVLSADELIELSKLFRKQSARSGVAALKNIWARHFNIIDGRARDKATAGRTAA